MGDITAQNFEKKFPEIKSNLEKAKFIGIDLEFSALNPISNCAPSLFDTPKRRYAKLRKNVEFTIPIQIGVTAFHFDPDKDYYVGNAYTFTVKPGLFSHINSYFCFENSALEFLALHNFDFNEFVYSSVPYLNKIQELDLKRKLKNKEILETNVNFALDVREVINSQYDVVNKWYKTAKCKDCLTFPEISEKFRNNIEFKYFFHKHFRRAFKNVWTYEHEGVITFKKVDEEEYSSLEKCYNLDDQLVQNLLGFARVYKLLTSLKKPLIAHNALLDILILINNFEGFLPVSYTGFKKLSMTLFPIIFDTKHICYNIRKLIPEDKLWESTDLKSLFIYFSKGKGRSLTINWPQIEIQTEALDIYDKFHNAGWDSFCAGYIFIRMAHYELQASHPKSKIFMPVEYVNGLKKHKNCVNVIRASINHINLGGDDPESIRPPLLVIEAVNTKKLDLRELNSVLSAYGNVEVKPFSWWTNKAILAVENYGSLRSLTKGLEKNSKFRIQEYSYIRHSPVVHFSLWGGVAVTGITLILIACKYQRIIS